MLLLFLFVCCFCVFVCVFFFCFVFSSRDRNMISIGTVEFRHYVPIIIPVNFGKP